MLKMSSYKKFQSEEARATFLNCKHFPTSPPSPPHATGYLAFCHNVFWIGCGFFDTLPLRVTYSQVCFMKSGLADFIDKLIRRKSWQVPVWRSKGASTRSFSELGISNYPGFLNSASSSSAFYETHDFTLRLIYGGVLSLARDGEMSEVRWQILGVDCERKRCGGALYKEASDDRQ